MSRVGESVGSGLRDRLIRPDYERPIGGGVYGRSPAVDVLPEIRVVNYGEKVRIRGAAPKPLVVPVKSKKESVVKRVVKKIRGK